MRVTSANFANILIVNSSMVLFNMICKALYFAEQLVSSMEHDLRNRARATTDF
jgi:hypothetical protein